MAGILDAAAGVFADAGYERATTNAIAAAAGISPGSLYQFFPNKEAIAEALAAGLTTDQHGRTARVSIQIFQAMLPLVLAADEDERPAVVGELKKVLRGYLGPVIGKRSEEHTSELQSREKLVC